jgi:hypothetical protein
VSLMSYVQKHPKTGVYWFRRAIPVDIRAEFGGKRELKETLRPKARPKQRT